MSISSPLLEKKERVIITRISPYWKRKVVAMVIPFPLLYEKKDNVMNTTILRPLLEKDETVIMTIRSPLLEKKERVIMAIASPSGKERTWWPWSCHSLV